MGLYQAATGELITAARWNTFYNLLKGMAGGEDTIKLAHNVAGTLVLQPNSDPASVVHLAQVKTQAGVEKWALRSDGALYLADQGAEVGTLENGLIWRNGAKFYGRLNGVTVEVLTTVQALVPPHVAGRFYGNPGEVATATAGTSANILRAIPFYAPTLVTYTSIGLEITTAIAGAGRLGIYQDSLGVPGALVIDAGTIDTGTTGFKTIITSQALGPGWYWLACVFNAAPSYRAVSTANGLHILGSPSGTETSAVLDVYRSFTYGALPNPFGTPSFAADSVPRLMLGR